jgi:hydrogenase maturation protease
MILIAGVGNIFMGDDAFGSDVTRRLAERPAWPGVRIVDFGIRGLDLAFALMDEYDATIIVDATLRGGEPGTIYVIDPDLSKLDDMAAALDAHSMDPLRALALARSMGAKLTNIRIVGCEPATFEPAAESGLSRNVAAAVDRAIDVIESLIQECFAGCEKNQGD